MNNEAFDYQKYIGQPLTPREIQCLFWAAQGKTAEETGLILNLKKQTVRFYLSNAKLKLNAVKTTQAVCIAIKKGFI